MLRSARKARLEAWAAYEAHPSRRRLRRLLRMRSGTPVSLTFTPRTVVSAATELTPRNCHGQGRHHQDQARLQRRHRVLLRHQEELAHDDRKAEDEEIRSDREEARRIRRRQNPVSYTHLT